MDYRGVFLTTAVALSALMACSGPDPGAITFSQRAGASEPQAPGGSSGNPATPAGDAGGGTPVGTPDPVFGLTAMKWEDPGVQANGANAAHGGTVEGKDCSTATTCHGTGGPKLWLMGGTVYTAAQGGTVVPKAEVRIVDGANPATIIASAYTDNNGNFWMEPGGKTIPAGAKVGVRVEGGGAPKIMATPLTTADGGCTANRANCHGTAAQGKVYAN